MPGKARKYHQADVVEILEGFEITRTVEDFEPYQTWMSDLMVKHLAVLLGAFMGSGKTVAALYAAFRLLRAGKIKRVLVVAPWNVAADTWPDELLTWDFAREMSYSVLLGTAEQREAARLRDADIHIINRENLRWLYDRWGWRRWPYDALIYDEASRMKGGAKRTAKGRLSEFGHLTKLRPKFKRVWELTGTPAPEGVHDLWGPVHILDGGARLGTSLTAFEDRWFIHNPYERKLDLRPYAEAEILDRVKDVFFCLKEEDYLNNPPVKVVDRIVHLEPKHLSAYREFERTLLLEEYDVEAVNNGVLGNKLLQYANGSVYAPDDDGQETNLRTKTKAVHIHDRKLQELESIVSEAGGRPLLIAYSYKFDVHAILKRFPKFRLYGQNPNDMRDWNAGRIPGLLLHPASAAHGLNFQRGSNLAVWYGLNWSLELYQQFNMRLPRRGQKHDKVWLYRILAAGTRDVQVGYALEAKGATQDRITDCVRVRPDAIRRHIESNKTSRRAA